MTVSKIKQLCVCLFILAAGTPAIVSASTGINQSGAIERYAIYAASQYGGPDCTPLRYAGTDAKRLYKTMTEIGGISKKNSIVLNGTTKENLENAFNTITARISENKNASKGSEFFFYYSGHSDENALLLGNETYSYSDLKNAISTVPTKIHVVILDSCFSGNFIRAKGGSRKKPFLFDDTSIVKGHAYLSSSSENESSLESDIIGASFFTSSIITGLRGAADTSGDKKVSLNELYDYAFNNTLSQTELSTSGPQHPAYNIKLVGSGDLILTDISESDSMVIIPKTSVGKYIIRTKQGKLISEINKTAGNEMELALQEDTYIVTVITPDSTKQTSIQLKKGATCTLDEKNMKTVSLTTGTERGPQTNISYSPVCISIFPGMQFPADAKNSNVVISPFSSMQDKVAGIQLDALFGIVNANLRGVQTAGLLNILRGPGTGIQIAGLSNIAVTGLTGAQFSGLGNYLGGKAYGAQAAGLINIAQSGFNGVQFAGLSNYIGKKGNGIQTAGLINITQSGFNGVQFAGLSNYIGGKGNGIQASGLINITPAGLNGIQAAGFGNFSGGEEDGIQISGFINTAHKINGLQIGFINIAGENNGVALGLFNFIKNGTMTVGTYWEQHQLFLQYQGGTKALYTTILAGSPDNFNFDYLVTGAGIGTGYGIRFFRIDFELLYKQIITKDMLFSSVPHTYRFTYPSARLTASLIFAKHFGLNVSYNADLQVDEWNQTAFSYGDHGIKNSFTWGNTDCAVYTYWSFGVQYRIN
jgi:hypothetical protein